MEKDLQRQTNLGQRQSANLISLKKIDRPADLLQCKTIHQQIELHDKPTLVTLVSGFIQKCAWRLELSIDNQRVTDQAISLIDQYGFESLEDISEALRKGGQGIYDYGHHKRGTLPGALVREWIGRHLEEKVAAKEKQHQNIKHRNPLVKDSEGVGFDEDQITDLHQAIKDGEQKRKSMMERQRKERRLIEKYNRGMFRVMGEATDMKQAKQDYVTEFGTLEDYVKKHLTND